MHPQSMWTGYFTSRATFKDYERQSNNILQVTRQVNAFADTNLRNDIFPLSKSFLWKSEEVNVSTNSIKAERRKRMTVFSCTCYCE